MNLLAMTQHMGVRYEEIGFLASGAGGALIALGNMMPFARRSGSMLGGLLIAGGMALAIVGVHYGNVF